MTLQESTPDGSQDEHGEQALIPMIAPDAFAMNSGGAPPDTSRLGDMWLIEDGILSTHLQVLPADEVDSSEDDPSQRTFSQRVAAARMTGRERVRNMPPLIKRTLRSTLLLAILIIASAITVAGSIYAVARAGNVLHPTVPASSVDKGANQNGVVIVPLGQGAAPTPSVSDYLIGVWSAQSNPPAGGSTVVYLRLTYLGQPMPHVPVSLDVTYNNFTRTYAAVATDSYGIAAFNVGLGGAGGNRPVYLTGRYKVAGQQDITGDAIIVPE